jgi:hypothetical protein
MIWVVALLASVVCDVAGLTSNKMCRTMRPIGQGLNLLCDFVSFVFVLFSGLSFVFTLKLILINH